MANSLSAVYSERFAGGSIISTINEVRKPLQLSITMTEHAAGRTVPVSAVMAHSRMYLKIGGMIGLPKSVAGKWYEFPLRPGDAGSMASVIQSLESENPTSDTQVLAAGKKLRADGTQVIAGVETTRYTGYFAPVTALHALPTSERQYMAPILRQLTGNVTFTVWIDRNGQFRQTEELETFDSHTLTLTFTYLSINQPVTITIPPPSQIVHLPGSALRGA